MTSLHVVSRPPADLHGDLSRDGSDVSVGVTQVSLLSVGRKDKKRVMILP